MRVIVAQFRKLPLHRPPPEELLQSWGLVVVVPASAVGWKLPVSVAPEYE
jgi:hypothetical protein